MDLVYLSHCLPYPPNKGERIRAFHQVKHLASRHNVHVACFTRGEEEERSIPEFRKYCASLYTEPIHHTFRLARAAVQFTFGNSLVAAYYSNASLRKHVSSLQVDGAVVYTSAVASAAPDGLPDMLEPLRVEHDPPTAGDLQRMRQVGWWSDREVGRQIAVNLTVTKTTVAWLGAVPHGV